MDRGRGLWWRRLVGIDVRSLAALRVGLASVLIYDVLSRARDLEAHYADSGLLPRAALLDWKEGAYNFSVHLLSGVWWIQGLLLVLTLGAAIALLLGRHTRVAGFVCWLMVASIHARNPLILHGGDMLLRLLLFWGLFVPWGRVASIDALVRPAAARDSETLVVSAGTLALKLQLCGMYWFSAALKWHPAWVEDGTAVGMALKLDQLATPFGRFLTQWPEMLQAATFGTMWLETLGPALAFSPIFTAPLQLATVVLFAGFHLVGLAPALYLGIFPFVCAVGWTLFLPGRFWDEWWPRACPPRLLALGPSLSGLLRARARTLPAVHRGSPGPLRRSMSAFVQVVVLGLLVYVGLWNLRTVDFERWERVLPVSANGVGNVLQLGQIWNLFAPFPATEDGWLVFEGTRVGQEAASAAVDGAVDGAVDTVDARSDPRDPSPVSFEKPSNVSRSLGSERWKKYLMNLDDPQNGVHRRLFGAYLCRRWNREVEGDRRLASIVMYVMRERTLPSGEEEEPVRGRLWHQVCPLPEPAEEAKSP